MASDRRINAARGKAVSGLAAIIATIVLSVLANLLTPAIQESLGFFGEVLTFPWLPMVILAVLAVAWYVYWWVWPRPHEPEEARIAAHPQVPTPAREFGLEPAEWAAEQIRRANAMKVVNDRLDSGNVLYRGIESLPQHRGGQAMFAYAADYLEWEGRLDSWHEHTVSALQRVASNHLSYYNSDAGLARVGDESEWRAEKLTFLGRRLTRLGEILARL